jgi:predicted  nucleic acid-binding Zn-ribbon protein
MHSFEKSTDQVPRALEQTTALLSALRRTVRDVEVEIEVLEQMTAQISDLRRRVCDFEIEIEAEKDRTHIFDVQIAAFPILARNLRTRRDNLRATISLLETRLTGTSRSNDFQLAPVSSNSNR